MGWPRGVYYNEGPSPFSISAGLTLTNTDNSINFQRPVLVVSFLIFCIFRKKWGVKAPQPPCSPVHDKSRCLRFNRVTAPSASYSQIWKKSFQFYSSQERTQSSVSRFTKVVLLPWKPFYCLPRRKRDIQGQNGEVAKCIQSEALVKY